ncbi:MAG: hypothetical protein ACI9OJ_002253 [Myxococcota bacterium]
MEKSVVPASLVDPSDDTATPVDGVLVITDSILYALDAYSLDPAGAVLWQVDPLAETNAMLRDGSSDPTPLISTPSVGPDGTIYLAVAEWVLALTPDGRVKWKFGVGGNLRNAPILDPVNNRLYLVSKGEYRVGDPPNFGTSRDSNAAQSVWAVDSSLTTALKIPGGVASGYPNSASARGKRVAFS